MPATCHQHELGSRLRRVRVTDQAWALTLLAMFVLIVPTIRSNELSEINGSKERVEDVLLTTRVVNPHDTCLNGRRVAIVFSSSIQARLGRDHSSESFRLDGHRLPNGLLAPMTC